MILKLGCFLHVRATVHDRRTRSNSKSRRIDVGDLRSLAREGGGDVVQRVPGSLQVVPFRVLQPT